MGEPDLLSEIVSTSLGPLSRLSETVDLTLKQVSEWIAKPENRRDIFNLIGLLNAQTELLMAQHRVSAAARLVGLMHNEDAGPETVRRACKDLLKVRLVERARGPGQGLRGGDDLEPLPLPAPKRSLRDVMRELSGE